MRHRVISWTEKSHEKKIAFLFEKLCCFHIISQLTTNFLANYQLTTVFLAKYQLTTNPIGTL